MRKEECCSESGSRQQNVGTTESSLDPNSNIDALYVLYFSSVRVHTHTHTHTT